jgi:hypothetical protein
MMADQTKDEESEVSVAAIVHAQPKTRRSWSQLKRDLTDEELASPAAVKMLLDEVERLERENAELFGYRERYHEADKTSAILREQQKTNLSADIVFTAAITLGGVLLGLLQSVSNPTTSRKLLGLGVLMVVVGVAAKFIRRK